MSEYWRPRRAGNAPIYERKENHMPKIILASASPRRKELLQQINADFIAIPSEIDEDSLITAEMPPGGAARTLAEAKARAVSGDKRIGGYKNDCIIIGADTIVWAKGRMLGKPADAAEAFDMLSLLQDDWHTVYTGVCVIRVKDGEIIKTSGFTDGADVFIRSLEAREIDAYIKTGEPFDKAGAYAAQGFGALIVERVRGDFFTVVGLPVVRLNTVLAEYGAAFL